MVEFSPIFISLTQIILFNILFDTCDDSIWNPSTALVAVNALMLNYDKTSSSEPNFILLAFILNTLSKELLDINNLVIWCRMHWSAGTVRGKVIKYRKWHAESIKCGQNWMWLAITLHAVTEVGMSFLFGDRSCSYMNRCINRWQQ